MSIFSTNQYENFTFSLFTFIRELNYFYSMMYNFKDLYCGVIKNDSTGLFKRTKYFDEYLPVDLSESYPTKSGKIIPTLDELKELYKNSLQFDRWEPENYRLEGLKEFALFLDTAEKAFMHDNSAVSELWSEITGSTYVINFDTYEYKSKIIIEKTKIPNIGTFLSANSDDEYNKLFNAKSVYKTSIEISRNIGRKSISSFNYLSNDPIQFTDPIDDVIFENFKTDLSLKMKSIYDSIINGIINHGLTKVKLHSDFVDIVTWKEIMEYGLYYGRINKR